MLNKVKLSSLEKCLRTSNLGEKNDLFTREMLIKIFQKHLAQKEQNHILQDHLSQTLLTSDLTL